MSPSIRDRTSHGINADRLKLEGRRALRPSLVVLLGIIAAAASMGTVFSKIHARWPWQSEMTVHVAVQDAAGVLPKQNEVRISGLRVGTVTDMRLRRGQPVLTLSIDPKYGPIYRDADLRLRPQTALQDLYVDIVSRGSAAAGRLAEDAVLPAERTRGSVEVGDVLDTFNADTRERLKTLINQLGTGLDGHGEHLKAAFVELFPFLTAAQRLTAEAATRRRLVAGLVHDLRLVTDELGKRDTQLTSVVRDGSATFQELATSRDNLDALIAELPPTLARLQTSFATLRGTLDVVDPALRALRPTAAALDPGLRSLEDIADAANPALAALRPPVRSLRPLVRELDPTAQALARAFGRLRPQAPRLDRISARVVPCELAVQKFFQWTPSVFKFSDANGIFPRGEGVLGAETVSGGRVSTPTLKRGSSCTDKGTGR